MKFNKTVLASLIAIMGVSSSAIAVEKGDWFLHVRAINISPNDDSSVLNVGGSDLTGTGVTVDSSST